MASGSNKEPVFNEAAIEEHSIRILLVEDNPGDVLLVKELLSSSGIDFSLKHASTLQETLLVCLEENFDIILLDLGLPDSIGVETLKKILLFNTRSPVVVMTGLDDEDIALESLRQGAQDYLVKSRLTGENLVRGIKYGIERKKIQDLLKKIARQFSLLSSTTSAINECEDIASIYSVVCQNICQLLIKAGIAGIKLDAPSRIYSSGTEPFKSSFEEIERITEIDLGKSQVSNDGHHPKLYSLLNDGKLHKFNDTLSNKSASGLTAVRKELPVNVPFPHMYIVGFIRNEIIYGGALILTEEEIGAEDINIIETIGNQVSLSLHRKAIESELKESEERYRKLNRELEQKVKDRTHDLESTNYLLNQELVDRSIAEEALKKSEASLKELNATKDKFFSIIAHDLKNPFTCLLGSTEVLNEKLDNLDSEKIKNLVQIINDSARSGYSVLQNLLVWSRSQTGLIKFTPENFNLREVMDECISEMKSGYPRKEIYLTSEMIGDPEVIADRNMIATILRNLVDNAMKFTPGYGSVKITASANTEEMTISIKDTGIGIPERNLADLFRLDKKFTRPGTNKEQGTGLGLKICKEFIDMQSGKIEVKSRLNKGSEFVFKIPLSNK